MAPPDQTSLTLHATCVALNGNAVLIRGASGTGKSALGLTLMAWGARLVADDQVILQARDSALIATCPPNIAGRIEARGVGILSAQADRSAQVAMVVDLDKPEADRLPKRRKVTILGCTLPLLHGAEMPHLAPAVLQYLRAGRSV